MYSYGVALQNSSQPNEYVVQKWWIRNITLIPGDKVRDLSHAWWWAHRRRISLSLIATIRHRRQQTRPFLVSWASLWEKHPNVGFSLLKIWNKESVWRGIPQMCQQRLFHEVLGHHVTLMLQGQTRNSLSPSPARRTTQVGCRMGVPRNATLSLWLIRRLSKMRLGAQEVN